MNENVREGRERERERVRERKGSCIIGIYISLIRSFAKLSRRSQIIHTDVTLHVKMVGRRANGSIVFISHI